MENWNSNSAWNNDNYILKCIGQSFAPSKSTNNPMITLEFEVVSPESVKIGNDEFNVAGTKVPYYAVTKTLNEDGSSNDEKSTNNKKRLDELTTAFGLPNVEDVENPALDFVGKNVWALVSAQPEPRRKSPTAEQLMARQPGDILKNPMNGKPLVRYYPKINEIFGVAQ